MEVQRERRSQRNISGCIFNPVALPRFRFPLSSGIVCKGFSLLRKQPCMRNALANSNTSDKIWRRVKTGISNWNRQELPGLITFREPCRVWGIDISRSGSRSG